MLRGKPSITTRLLIHETDAASVRAAAADADMKPAGWVRETLKRRLRRLDLPVESSPEPKGISSEAAKKRRQRAGTEPSRRRDTFGETGREAELFGAPARYVSLTMHEVDYRSGQRAAAGEGRSFPEWARMTVRRSLMASGREVEALS